MPAPDETHLDADFSTWAGWKAWCHAQDGGCPDAQHDLRREPTLVERIGVALGAVAVFGFTALFWGTAAWLAWQAVWP